jgi:hypothetical protein
MSEYGTPPPPPYGAPPGGQPAYGSPPDNYLVWAIVYAAQVNSKWTGGDVAGAHASAAKAKQFAIWSAVVTVVLGVLSLVAAIGLAALGASTSNG